MNKKLKKATKDLFYPELNKQDREKYGNPRYWLWKLIMVIPVAAMVLYGGFLYIFVSKLCDLDTIYEEPLSYNAIVLIAAAVLCLLLVMSFKVFLKKNAYTKSRAIKSVVTTLSCLVASFVYLTWMMSLGLINYTAQAMLIQLAVAFAVAYFLFFYTITAYKKSKKGLFSFLVKKMPVFLLIGIILILFNFAGVLFGESFDEVHDNTTRAYDTIEYILKKDRYNVSFGTKKVTELVAFAITDGKSETITNYDLLCADNTHLDIVADEDDPLKSGDVFNVKELAKIKSLKTLNVTDIPNVKNISELKQIVELQIYNSSVDIPEKSMTGIQWIEFKGTATPYSEFIKKTPLINGLMIFGGKVNVNDLTFLKHINVLGLCDTVVINAGAISEFDQLKVLDVTAANDTAPTVRINEKCLGILSTLTLENARLSNPYNDIALMKKLEYLTVSNAGFSDLSVLADLDKLISVNLSGNKITDISALRGKNSIEFLILENNKIKDISPLAELNKLTYLDLDNNEIEDITPISALHKLERLSLSDNKIKVLPYLSCEDTLETIELDGNYIEDVSVLYGFKKLGAVDIRDNPVPSAQRKNFDSTVSVRY